MKELKHAYALANVLNFILIKKGIITEDEVLETYQIEIGRIHKIEIQQWERLASISAKIEEDRLCNKIMKFFKRK